MGHKCAGCIPGLVYLHTRPADWNSSTCLETFFECIDMKNGPQTFSFGFVSMMLSNGESEVAASMHVSVLIQSAFFVTFLN